MRKACSISSAIKYTVLNIMYFDLQIVVFSELSIVDIVRSLSKRKIYNGDGNSVSELVTPFRVYLSFVTSFLILLMMLSELK